LAAYCFAKSKKITKITCGKNEKPLVIRQKPRYNGAMGIITRQLLKVIEYVNTRHDTIIYKFPMNDRAEIMNGSSLTVREGQVAIFMKDGRIADIFAPGRYKLSTANLPVLTSIMSWAKGFNSPFKCDVYFVETTQFSGQKWGTSNPFTMRDKDFGMIRVKGYGKYSFRVTDARLFMQTMTGSKKEYTTDMINDHLRGIIMSEMTDIIAASGFSAIDLASKLTQFNEIAKQSLADDFEAIGLALVTFVVENLSFPEDVEKAIDKSSSLGILGGQMGNYTKMAAADAMREAAKNPGTIGTVFGMGMVGGLGAAMTAGMSDSGRDGATRAQTGVTPAQTGARFCPECGAPRKPDAKFCTECGAKL
jgi:membrane protease subunit (stomatin/prohibitin family)